MSLKRIWTMVLRYLYTSRDMGRITEFLVWPLIDIGFFGLIATWSGQLAHQSSLVQIFITALVLWQIIYRANFEICVNLSDECTDQNLFNIIASPLKKSEWVLALMLNGLLKIIFTLLYGALVGYLFFGINIFAAGIVLLPFIALCLLSGWMIGFFAAAIVIYKGAKLQSLPWIVIMTAAIFSALFYPLHILPKPLALISQGLPMSYIFESLRALFLEGSIPSNYWFLSTILSLVYLAVAIKCFLYMFERSRNRGFARIQ